MFTPPRLPPARRCRQRAPRSSPLPPARFSFLPPSPLRGFRRTRCRRRPRLDFAVVTPDVHAPYSSASTMQVSVATFAAGTPPVTISPARQSLSPSARRRPCLLTRARASSASFYIDLAAHNAAVGEPARLPAVSVAARAPDAAPRRCVAGRRGAGAAKSLSPPRRCRSRR